MPHRFLSRKAFIQILCFIAAGIAVVGSPNAACAQDTFEIRVEQYEQPVLGRFTLEEHLNDVGIGTASLDGTIAATHHQFHMSTEFTAGISSNVSLGLMVLTALVPGHGGLQYAGWRVLPHFYLPDSLHFPVRFGLTAEFSFQPTLFAESARTLELRPIIEGAIGRVQLDANPSTERSLSGSQARNRWNFQPSLRFAYQLKPRFSPILEYYGAAGSLAKPLPLEQQVHQIYPGGSLRLSENILWDLGIGVGLTPAGNRLVYKTRIEFSLGRTNKDTHN